MKSLHEIKERINQLKSSQKNGVDNSIELSILETSLLLSEEQIKTTLKNQVKQEKYKEAKVSLWILSESLNNGF